MSRDPPSDCGFPAALCPGEGRARIAPRVTASPAANPCRLRSKHRSFRGRRVPPFVRAWGSSPTPVDTGGTPGGARVECMRASAPCGGGHQPRAGQRRGVADGGGASSHSSLAPPRALPARPERLHSVLPWVQAHPRHLRQDHGRPLPPPVSGRVAGRTAGPTLCAYSPGPRPCSTGGQPRVRPDLGPWDTHRHFRRCGTPRPEWPPP